MNEKKEAGGSGGGSAKIAVDIKRFSHSMTTVFYGLAELFSSMGAVEEGTFLQDSDLVGDAEKSVARARVVEVRRKTSAGGTAAGTTAAGKTSTGKTAAGTTVAGNTSTGGKVKEGVDTDADGKDEGENPGTGGGSPGEYRAGNDGGAPGNDGAMGAEEQVKRVTGKNSVDGPGEPAAAGLDADHSDSAGRGSVPAHDSAEVSACVASTGDVPSADANAVETVDTHSDGKGESGDGEEGDAGSEGAISITPDDITKVIVAKIKQDRKNSAKIKKMLKEKYRADKVSELKSKYYEAFLTDISGM